MKPVMDFFGNMLEHINQIERHAMTEDMNKIILDAIVKRLSSPKNYTFDSESITMDTPDDIAKLIRMLKQEEEGKKPKTSPFRIAVCRNNAPIW